MYQVLACFDTKSADKSVLDQLVADSDDDDHSVGHEVLARLGQLPESILQEFPGGIIRKAVLADNGTVLDFH